MPADRLITINIEMPGYRNEQGAVERFRMTVREIPRCPR